MFGNHLEVLNAPCHGTSSCWEMHMINNNAEVLCGIEIILCSRAILVTVLLPPLRTSHEERSLLMRLRHKK